MASQLELFPLTSPCIGRCEADTRGYCLGCFRSRQERFDWPRMSPDQQREVLRLCRQRARRQRTSAAPSSPAEQPDQLSLFSSPVTLPLTSPIRPDDPHSSSPPPADPYA